MANQDVVVKAAKSTATGTADKGGAGIAPPKYLGDRKRTVEVKLDWPLEYDGVEYKKLTISRLRGDQLLNLGKVGDDEIAIFAIMCGVPRAVIAYLDGADMSKVAEKSADFLPQELAPDPVADAQTGNPGTSTQPT